ncbi:cation-dependent mannose-6-phosphate receptor-like [Homarus americanus]|uniref:Cation-dependent mannose-6-phosphate receptor-like 1 n=1 Tax=Homarus americanus TaxID=6706 RepID=A0A8J5MMX3_HOMAM|nr:cation-dependent mannose-6-phosphate receptor-like [Homarus americanus]KAG7157418.1 Cation-dependent mannose-6-phosphate receptor-like 1 [Homarus americanus]
MMMVKVVVTVMVCVLELVNANKCVIDSSVPDQEKKTQYEYLKTLDPIIGKRSELKLSAKDTYTFVVCDDADPAFKNVSFIWNLGDTDSLLGFNNRTLVTKARNSLMLTFLGAKGLEGKYKKCNGTAGASHILFLCDHQQHKVQLEILEDFHGSLTCSMMFVVRHSCVCSLSNQGLSGGAIFFIILLVIFGSYFTFGFFYLRLVKGAKGVEQIPNREFWFKIGNMLADGCGAVFRCDRYCGARGTGSAPSSYGGYSPIDERLAQDLQDTDRDSSLLNP